MTLCARTSPGKWWAVGLGVVGLGLLAACGSSSASTPPTATGTPAQAAGAAAGTGGEMGQSVSDGNYSFVVDGSRCGISSFADSSGTATPTQAQFCAVVVTMTNRTDSPQDVPPYPTMIDRTGTMYNTTGDPSAETAAEQDYFGADYRAPTQVNPGGRYRDVFVYDVPQGTQAASVQLHGRFASAGVSVALKTSR